MADIGADLVVAADGGLDSARRLGLSVDVVVGDLDSVSPAGLHWAESSGARIQAHPTRKDQTDLELALGFAAVRAEAIHVVASAGGRLDHALANLLVLASDRWAENSLSASIGGAHVDVVRGRRALGGSVGDLVSLLAVDAAARGVTTTGLEYQLRDETLQPAAARGVANVIVEVPPTVTVRHGVLLAIRPPGPSSVRTAAPG